MHRILPLTLATSLFIKAQTLAPPPLKPFPTPQQLAWQQREFIGFVHFSLNTYYDQEWGYGNESVSMFNPSWFNADSVVLTMKKVGMKEIILTCKHHGGFCLWPSRYTEYSVKNSPWRDGKGDMVKEFSEACKRHDIRFGVYLSPWDRNHRDYGKPEYIAYYRHQLEELLTQYGEIAEVWFDGANGGTGYYGGADETRTIDRKAYYGWQETWALVRRLQPTAVIFSDIGPDVRWVGNENGIAGETCWSTYSPVGERGDESSVGYVRASEGIEGHRDGRFWLPPECDVSIRPGWFYHSREDSLVKKPYDLFDLYFKSVGRNGVLLLNIPLDPGGRINRNDVQSLMGLKQLLDSSFRQDFARHAFVQATNVRAHAPEFSAEKAFDGNNDSYWTADDSAASAALQVTLPSPSTVNCIMLQEQIALGQRVEAFSVEDWNGKSWRTIAKGTTIGNKRLLRFPRLTISRLRVVIEKSKAAPTISTISLFLVPDVQ